MEELTLSKNDELFALQEKLNSTIANNAKTHQANLEELEAIKEELAERVEQLVLKI